MAAGSGHLASRQGVRGELSDEIDTLFATLDRPHHPGGVVAVLRAGEVVHRRGYGVADVEHDVPFTPRTVLRLGSTSKHIAATAILLLENRGQLSLEDEIHRFVPELPSYGAAIRLHHLLTMTSGLPDGLSRLLFAGMSARHPVSRRQILALQARTRELLFSPGTYSSYSNTNYNLLSLAIERTSGCSLRQFLRREIFDPLGMVRTELVADAREIVPGRASGYQPAEESEPLDDAPAGTPVRGSFPVELCGDGGIDSTLDDMILWLANYRAGATFGPDYRARMETEAVLANGERTGYALGLCVDRYRGLRKVSHAGGMPGYLCDLALFESADGNGGRPGDDLAVVQLWNWTDPSLLETADRIADMALAAGWEAGDRGGASSVFVTRGSSPPQSEWTAGLYACFETGELLELAGEGDVVCVYLGEATPLLATKEGSARAAKRSLLFSLTPGDGGGAGAGRWLEVRFGAQPPRRFEATAEAKPAELALDDYAAIYHSRELGEELRVLAGEGELEVALTSPLRTLLWRRLVPLGRDLFYAAIDGLPTRSNVSARFRRNAAGAVDSLSFMTSRAGSVRFARVADRAPEEP